MTTFNQGDIVRIDFNPSVGREMRDPHYALVVSPRDFNQLGLTLVCPISGGEAGLYRNKGWLISLMGAGLKVDGCVHAHQAKALDLDARRAKFHDRAPEFIVQAVMDVISNMLTLEPPKEKPRRS